VAGDVEGEIDGAADAVVGAAALWPDLGVSVYPL
jgi:hypothetical protein